MSNYLGFSDLPKEIINEILLYVDYETSRSLNKICYKIANNIELSRGRIIILNNKMIIKYINSRPDTISLHHFILHPYSKHKDINSGWKYASYYLSKQYHKRMQRYNKSHKSNYRYGHICFRYYKIQNNWIQGNSMQNSIVQNNKIQNNSIQNNKIQNNGIQNNKIQNNWIQGNKRKRNKNQNIFYNYCGSYISFKHDQPNIRSNLIDYIDIKFDSDNLETILPVDIIDHYLKIHPLGDNEKFYNKSLILTFQYYINNIHLQVSKYSIVKGEDWIIDSYIDIINLTYPNIIKIPLIKRELNNFIIDKSQSVSSYSSDISNYLPDISSYSSE